MTTVTAEMPRRFSPKTLKQLREAKGWNETQLAARVGCTANTIRNWESGEFKPGLQAYVALCEALSVDLDALLEQGPI